MKKGFTLIELLVVISIISLLSSVILSSVSTARAKARDARRVVDLRQIQKALIIYYDNHGTYPSCTSTTYIVDGTSDCLSTALRGDNLFQKLPVDPRTPTGGTGTWGRDYQYSSNNSDQWYNLRGGFETNYLPQTHNYPDGVFCQVAGLPVCNWYNNSSCVYNGYNYWATCGRALQLGAG